MAGVSTQGVQHLSTYPTATEKAIPFIRSKLRRGFYGSVTLKIEDGHVTYLDYHQGFRGNDIPATSPQPDTQESLAVRTG